MSHNPTRKQQAREYLYLPIGLSQQARQTNSALSEQESAYKRLVQTAIKQSADRGMELDQCPLSGGFPTTYEAIPSLRAASKIFRTSSDRALKRLTVIGVSEGSGRQRFSHHAEPPRETTRGEAVSIDLVPLLSVRQDGGNHVPGRPVLSRGRGKGDRRSKVAVGWQYLMFRPRGDGEW